MAGRASGNGFDVARRAVLPCNIAIDLRVPRQDPVLRAERGNAENAADVKANRALVLA
jgi:hypothetical protein